MNQAILALDLGNRCGWAAITRDGVIEHGTMSFAPAKNQAPGQRWITFRSWLASMLSERQIHQIWYERVVFGHSSSSASDVYGGYRALVEMASESHRVMLESVAVSTIKKAWTGNGRADKDEMMRVARDRGFAVRHSDEADALAILSLAISRENAR